MRILLMLSLLLSSALLIGADRKAAIAARQKVSAVSKMEREESEPEERGSDASLPESKKSRQAKRKIERDSDDFEPEEKDSESEGRSAPTKQDRARVNSARYRAKKKRLQAEVVPEKLSALAQEVASNGECLKKIMQGQQLLAQSVMDWQNGFALWCKDHSVVAGITPLLRNQSSSRALQELAAGL